MFFLIFLLVLLIILLCIITVKVKIKIINLELNTKNGKGKYINEEFLATMTIYILDKIPVWKMNIDKVRLMKIQTSNRLNKIKNNLGQKFIENKNDFDKNILLAIYKIPLTIYDTNIDIEIGTEGIILTTFLVPIISTIISVILSKYDKNYNSKFKIKPIYNQKNTLKLEFNGIFEIKMIHIINTICILKKKKGRVKKNVRTSNRMSYDYSYE